MNNKSIAKVLILLIVVLGFCFVSYDMIFMIKHHEGGSKVANELGFLGPVTVTPEKMIRSANSDSKFRVAVTATDEAYSQWQCRIMYYWYKKVKDMPGSSMGKFTRILHSGRPDQLMDEIPTIVVDPLPGGLDRGYVVLNRPWAFAQWILDKENIEEEYILMAEPDHIFVNPLPNLAHGTQPAGYPFFYIRPDKHEKIIRKFYPEEKGPITDIDPTGNSPVIIQKSLLEQIAPTWVKVSLDMKGDPETDETFGWILEMYAYAVASALHGVRHILQYQFMLQLPWDRDVGDMFMIHYTNVCEFNSKGEITHGNIGEWRFDKRSYLKGPPPRNLSLPPPGAPDSVVQLIKMINEASANIPEWDSLNKNRKKDNKIRPVMPVTTSH